MLRGGCLVESDIGAVDATIESRWRRCTAQLGVAEAWDGPEATAADDLPHHGGHIAIDDDDF